MPLAEIRKDVKLSAKLKVAAGLLLSLLVFLIAFVVFFSTGKTLSYTPEFPVPEISPEGLSPEPVMVHINAPGGFEIFYTTDGTTPDAPSWIKYDGPFRVDSSSVFSGPAWIRTSPKWSAPEGPLEKQSVIKAVLVRNDTVGPVGTSHIIVRKKSLPFVSVSASFDSLLGFSGGILNIGRKYEDKDLYAADNIKLDIPWWEYPANYADRGSSSGRRISVYSEGTSLGKFNAFAELRVHGSASRGFSQKSLRFYLNDSTLPQAFVLRNGGNDWDRAFLRDVFCQRLFSEVSPFARPGSPVVLYLNGFYWGLYNIRAYQDPGFIAGITGVPEEKISMLDVDLSLFRGPDAPKEMIRFWKNLKNGIHSQHKHPMKEIAKWVDISSFCDYLIYNIYLANTDWPHNNFRLWMASGDSSDYSKWHFLPTDHDFSLGFNGARAAANKDMLNLVYESTTSTGNLFRALSADPEFRKMFRQKFENQMKGPYSPEHMLFVLDSMEKEYLPFMDQQFQRWGIFGGVNGWRNEINSIREFIKLRKTAQDRHLRDFFGKFED